MQTLIIEDEDSSYDVLEGLIQRCAPQLSVLGRAKSVEQALALIKEFTPELVFMDIDLPDGTGFDIIQKLKPIDFSIIFVTAYNQYAVQAFRFSATDFLLKPVNEEEFKEAIEKAASSERQKNYNLRLDVLLANLQAQMSDGKKIILKTLEDIFIVYVKDI
ncbi:MAG TPA: response regulator, partial [Tenuifilaceae bacterium]|nr:response regulator [Tenuifilaceae bacterium]